MSDQPDIVFQKVATLAQQYVFDENRHPAKQAFAPDWLSDKLDLELPEKGRDLDEVMDHIGDVLSYTPTTSSTRFFNQLFGGRDIAATAAEMLACVTNNSMYTYKAAGPQILIENMLINRLCQYAGFVTSDGVGSGGGMFCPGGSLSNLTAMLVARNETCERARIWGLDGSTLRVYASAEAHYSISKAAGMLGLGTRNIQEVPVDESGRLCVDDLQRLICDDLDQGFVPFMVIATAGTTVQGAFDPVNQIADIAERYKLWLHIDGAYGGSILMSEKHRHLLAGMERADSLTWDAHKMLGVPLTCSVLLVKNPEVLARSLSESASYLFQQDDDQLNPGTRSLQCGRRNDAFKLWAAWQHHGDLGFARRVDRLIELAQYAADRICNDDRMTLCKKPESTNICFEVCNKSSQAICHALDQEGRMKVGFGIVDGRFVIRLVCVNPEIDEQDLDLFFDEVLAVAKNMPDADNACEVAVSTSG